MNAIKGFNISLWKWVRERKLIVKLRIAFAFFAALTVVVGIVGLVACTLLDHRVEIAYQQDLPVVSAIKEAGISQLKAMRVLLRVVLAAGDNDEIDKQSRDLAAALAGERKNLNDCQAKLTSPEGLAQLHAALKLIPKFEKGANDIVVSAKAGDVIGFRNTIIDLVPISDQIQHSFDQVSKITEKQAIRSKLLSVITYFGARLVMTPLLIVAGLIAAVMSFIMSHLFSAPLARMTTVLDAVGKGDLTLRLAENSADEMGHLARSLNQALSSVRETLLQVNRTAVDVQATSGRLAATASSLAEGAITQASHLDETSTILEQISATIRTNADHAGHANELGASARQVAQRGDSSVGAAITAMEEIRTSSSEISNILSAVHDISFQSNLLAINASIESAHAGESGRTFAAVASEMRFLAERSKDYARNIESLIATSMDRIERGSKLVDDSGKALADIMVSVKNLSSTIGEIDEACKKQAIGVEDVSHAMNRVDEVVHETSLKTQLVSASAQELAGAASGLTKTLTHFKFESSAGNETQVPDDLSESLLLLKTWVSSRYQTVRRRLGAINA